MERVQSLAHDLIEAGNEHFRIATQPQRVLFWMADTAGACELVSDNWPHCTGQKIEDALGQGWLQVVQEQDRAALLAALRLSVSTQQGFQLQYRMRKADGGARWVLHDAAARYLPSGKFNGLVGTLTDQADHQAGARALERAAQQVYDFLEGIALATVAMDFDGRVVQCNQVMATLCGRERAELLGENWLDAFVSPQARAHVAALVDGLIAPSVLPAEMEYPIETPQGNRLFRWQIGRAHV